jgi:hypothetical protein
MNTDDGDLRRLFPPTMTPEQEKEFMKKATEVPEQLIAMVDACLGEKDQVIVPKKHPLFRSMRKWKKHMGIWRKG